MRISQPLFLQEMFEIKLDSLGVTQRGRRLDREEQRRRQASGPARGSPC